MAERILYVREKMLGITQAEFGGKLGVSRGAVGNWELHGGISTKNLTKITKIAPVTLDWLIHNIGATPKQGARSFGVLNDRDRDLIAATIGHILRYLQIRLPDSMTLQTFEHVIATEIEQPLSEAQAADKGRRPRLDRQAVPKA